jgi:ADP-ribose pyrophosphatase YjhB (NUDIX family)
MEWGETPEQTALRELQEETGLTARLGMVLGVFSQWFTVTESQRGEPGHVIGVIYEGVAVSGSLRTSWDLGTTDGAEWFTLDEARSLSRVRLVDFVLGLVS